MTTAASIEADTTRAERIRRIRFSMALPGQLPIDILCHNAALDIWHRPANRSDYITKLLTKAHFEPPASQRYRQS